MTYPPVPSHLFFRGLANALVLSGVFWTVILLLFRYLFL